KTAFRYKYKLFKYLVILFRLINASFIIAYLNNILIFLKTKKEYKKYIELVL
ncbi:hypothetical protein K432DRAFT_314940, partial [Lepidopterella palustris CBS 459.81]